MRLGLFGGTFDPVHYGHLLLAECCREECRLDEVRFLPAAVPPHKRSRELTPAKMRIEMLQLAVAGHSGFSVSRYEADRGGVNYTADTLAHVRQQDPAVELFFLLGADMLNDLPNWRRPDDVCRLATPIVVRRSGTEEPDFDCLARVASPQRIAQFRRHQVKMPDIGISSSEIRRRMAAGLSIRYRTPRAVEEYVRTHGLYAPA
ncbi:MAG: nicotinate (nicotinamide) nucleotide adenylyltransferase [Planctomycetes bacterium RBG_13_63_9]|nr:MAG: nicotinate (nicotinamide) nucleotide adenylyltransferase [Planctomycetes bacterium RBG_13_63_9]